MSEKGLAQAIAEFLSTAMIASGTASVEHESDLVIRALHGLPGASVGERISVAHAVKRLRAPLPFEMASKLHALLVDPAINPRKIERAGWRLLLDAGRIPADGPEAVAHWLEEDDFARALLSQSHVTLAAVEHILTGLRRWLLLSGRASDFPRAVEALVRQAAHNAGAWLIDTEEQACLESHGGILRAAYLPDPPAAAEAPDYDDPVTRAVAEQYNAWPYPAWQRAMMGRGESFTQVIGAIAPDAPQALPENARTLELARPKR